MKNFLVYFPGLGYYSFEKATKMHTAVYRAVRKLEKTEDLERLIIEIEVKP